VETERIVAGHCRSSLRRTRPAAAVADGAPAPIAAGPAAAGSPARVNRERSSWVEVEGVARVERDGGGEGRCSTGRMVQLVR
jgi:hypothetical protein